MFENGNTYSCNVSVRSITSPKPSFVLVLDGTHSLSSQQGLSTDVACDCIHLLLKLPKDPLQLDMLEDEPGIFSSH